jgi:hypothetical protein
VTDEELRKLQDAVEENLRKTRENLQRLDRQGQGHDGGRAS